MFMIQRQQQGTSSSSGVPSEYMEVDYLESTGSQYLKLGYMPEAQSGRTEIVTSTTTTLGTLGIWGFIQVSYINNRIAMGIASSKWFCGVGATVYSKAATVGERVSLIFDRNNKTFTVNDAVSNFTTATVLTSYEAFLFGRNDGNGDAYGTSYSGRVYSFKEYGVGDELLMHLVPVIHLATNKPGMWDLVNKVFLINEGTGEFKTAAAVEETYTEIAYVEAEGSQWIDTGLPNTMDLIFDDQVNLTYDNEDTPGGDGQWIIGGRINGTLGVGLFRGKSGFFNMYGGPSRAYVINNVTKGDWINIAFERTNLTTYNETTKTTSTYPVSGQILVPVEYETNMLLGKNQVNYAGTGDDPRNMYGKRRYCKITDATTGNVLREFVPVMADQTGKIGLLDKVNNKFYESIGPEAFIGPGILHSYLTFNEETLDKTNLVAMVSTTGGHTPGLAWRDWTAEEKTLAQGRSITLQWTANFNEVVMQNPHVILGYSTNIYYEDGTDAYLTCYQYLDNLGMEAGVPFTQENVSMAKTFTIEDKPIRDVITRQAQFYLPRVESGSITASTDWLVSLPQFEADVIDQLNGAGIIATADYTTNKRMLKEMGVS